MPTSNKQSRLSASNLQSGVTATNLQSGLSAINSSSGIGTPFVALLDKLISQAGDFLITQSGDNITVNG